VGHRNRRSPDLQVRPVETSYNGASFRDSESRADVLDHRWRCGCRKSQHALCLQIFYGFGQLEIVRPKIVSPFGNAVRFVDRKQRDVVAPDYFEESLIIESFGRNVEKL